jgi:Family of unknown function (DUF6166)
MIVAYKGLRGFVNGPLVCRIDERGKLSPLPTRNDLDNHSPDGFEWGYAGSGPAQLALAILADALGDDQRALSLHQRFKRDFIQNWNSDSWSMKAAEVREWATTIGRER